MLHDPEGAAVVDLVLQMADAGFEALCDTSVVFSVAIWCLDRVGGCLSDIQKVNLFYLGRDCKT